MSITGTTSNVTSITANNGTYGTVKFSGGNTNLTQALAYLLASTGGTVETNGVLTGSFSSASALWVDYCGSYWNSRSVPVDRRSRTRSAGDRRAGRSGIRRLWAEAEAPASLNLARRHKELERGCDAPRDRLFARLKSSKQNWDRLIP